MAFDSINILEMRYPMVREWVFENVFLAVFESQLRGEHTSIFVLKREITVVSISLPTRSAKNVNRIFELFSRTVRWRGCRLFQLGQE